MKLVKRFLALVLVALMMLALAGCGGGDAAKLVGTWESTLDVKDQIMEAAASEGGDIDEFLQYMTFDKFDMKLVMTFGEDGSYTMGVDEAVFTSSMEDLKESMSEGVYLYLEDMLTQSAE